MLNSLKIKRFRALEDFSVSRLGRVNLMVGKNNAGKSTVLEALQIYAAGGSVSLLETLARQHGEWVSHERAHDWPSWEAQQLANRQQDGSAPFVGFFSGRIFPSSDEGIEIGEDTAENRLHIEHGYYVEWQTPIHDEADGVVSHYRRVSKDKAAETASQSIALQPALFIKKGARQCITDLNGRRIRSGAIETLPCACIPSGFVSMDDMANEWDNIALTDGQEVVKSALQLITPDFMDISFVKINDHGLTRTAKIRLRGTPYPVPLGSMGDGMLRVLQITLKIFAARGGLLLIDEFENGLHYSVQEKIWTLIFQLAEQLDIQVFATTHSWDCIESFAKVAVAQQGSEGVLFRLGRSARASDHGKVIATVFDEAQLQHITQADVEVR